MINQFGKSLRQTEGFPYSKIHRPCLILPIERREVRFREQTPLTFLHAPMSETATKKRSDATHRQVRLQSHPLAIVLPQEASCEKLAGKHDYQERIHDELEQSEKPNLFLRGRIALFRSDRFTPRELLLAFFLSFEPCLVLSFLFHFVFLVPAIITHIGV